MNPTIFHYRTQFQLNFSYRSIATRLQQPDGMAQVAVAKEKGQTTITSIMSMSYSSTPLQTMAPCTALSAALSFKRRHVQHLSYSTT